MGRLRMKWILMLGIIFSVVLSNAQEEEELVQELFEEEGDESKPNITLTGIPQIDYIHDPNLPRELNGYDLSTYPFLNKMPKNITFKCDGRHDGFYANIEWNCQVYHQCLFGIRYDFMCANFTSFDQKNFNCIFASDVDCPNSERFFDRNDALYKTTTTTTETPPFLGILRNQRPRRPHPQLARLRNSENPRFEEYEDYDLPVIPKQRVEESKFQNAVNSDQEPIQDISSQKLSQELGENGIVASFPVRAGTGQGRLRAIAQRRRRPGRPNRRRPFRPVYYDDYYDYYDDEYALTDKNDYDYDYSNNRFSIRRPGKKRPSQAKVNQGSQDQEETGISDQEKELSARPKNVENNSADAVEAQESKTQLSPTPEERRRLFQQRGSLKQRGPIEPPMLKTTTMITAQTSTTTTMKPSTSEQDVEYYYDIEYVDEDPDQPFEEAVITTTKSDTVPKLQPAFRRAGLPERQVRTEEPLTTEPTSSVSRSVEEPVGATKLRNRLNFLRSRDRETVRHSARAQTSSIPSSSTESQITVEAVTEPEPKRKSGRRSQRPSIVAIVETEDPQPQMIEITTFRNQRSRRINRNREIKS